MTDIEPELKGDFSSVGVIQPVKIPATRFKQGDRTQYHIVIPVLQVNKSIQRPDPEKPLPQNRRVDPSRAKKFSEYVRKNRDWVAPGIIVRTPSHELQFEISREFANGTAWGILSIPLELIQQLPILDGQHRTLGLHYAEQKVYEEIQKLKTLLKEQKEQGQPDSYLERTNSQLAMEESILGRLRTDHISIDIVEVDEKDAKQLFTDINNNAKGVNPDFTTMLDQREAVNRIAVDLINTHPLLKDIVEEGQSTRMSSSNENLIGAKAVADIVRSTIVGTGRIGARVEDEIGRNPRFYNNRVAEFLTLLMKAFPGLSDVAAGRSSPKELRSHSMLGSATMLRVLACVFHELVPTADSDDFGVHKKQLDEVEKFFASLDGHMEEIPMDKDNPLWMSTNAFIPQSNAPQARLGSISSLVNSLVDWAHEGNEYL